ASPEPAPPASARQILRERAKEPRVKGAASRVYELPQLDLLAEPKKPTAGTKISQDALDQNARVLEGVLDDFSVRGEIINVRPGPVVTLYELEPAPGIKSSRVIGLADDIARSMSAISARVAVVPGRNAIGIELPNQRREMVYLRELLTCEDFSTSKHKLAIALGKTIGGEPVIVDLARMPHLLVAGTTGSGKSVAINTMILSLLYRLKPEECRLIMVDPKMLELSVYDNIPHLLTPVVTDPKKAVVALKWAVREMEDRYKKMSKVGVRNIDGFNARVVEARGKGEVITRTVQTGFDPETGEAIFEREEMDLAPLPYIVVIVDEMADLMLVAGKDIEGAIQRLAQMARAAGIHLIMATQRPSVDVITGTIKANFPTRISFQVTSKIDSRTILSEMGAEQLLGQGDMLYMAGGGRISRVHGPFVSDGEVEKIVAYLRTQGQPQYLDAITSEDEAAEAAAAGEPLGDPGSMDAEESGDLYNRAVAIVLRDKKCSTSYIQRRLSVGYNKAASLVEQMEREGVVSPANHSGKREILVGGGVDRGAFDIEAAE
ncbi:MAG: DNA translocase FtsK, partial [Methylocystis sp.]